MVNFILSRFQRDMQTIRAMWGKFEANAWCYLILLAECLFDITLMTILVIGYYKHHIVQDKAENTIVVIKWSSAVQLLSEMESFTA